MTKKIEAIFREEKLIAVKEALSNIGIVGMNVMEVRGHGRQGGIELAGRIGTYKVDLLPRVQLNIILSDHNVEKTIETIQQVDRIGDTHDPEDRDVRAHVARPRPADRRCGHHGRERAVGR